MTPLSVAVTTSDLRDMVGSRVDGIVLAALAFVAFLGIAALIFWVSGKIADRRSRR